MIPGVNPRQLKQMMKQMGMSQEDIEAKEVIIKTNDGKIYVFENAEVQKISMQGQTTFQISGKYSIEEEKVKIEISEEDIELVSKEANVSKEKAKETLDKTNGDIAQAIINLTE